MSMLGCNRSGKKEADESNPKTMPLIKLAQLIEPKLMSYYLEQVSKYLKNKKKDLWLPLISPYLDAFLVRIIQDSQNLRNLLHVLDDKSRELATDVADTLDANKHLYTVVHSYVNSNMNKNVLVYRKVIESKFEQPNASTFVRTPTPTPPPPEEPVPRNPSDVPRKIPLPFKLQWITATHRFVKDTTTDSLEYPEMSIDQADFVYSLIRQKKTDNDSDPGIQHLYIPFKESLRQFNAKNEFKATFTYFCGDIVRLYLEKLPLNNNNSEVKKPDPEDTSDPIDLDNLTKAQKHLARKTTMLKKLDFSFIKTALQMILDFIHEDTEASIVFRNANDEQCHFLQSALAMAKSRKLHGVFDEEHRNLLRKIGKYLSNCQFFDLKIDTAKMEKGSMMRTVALTKTPKEEYRSPTYPSRNPAYINQYSAQSIDNDTPPPKYQSTDNISAEKDTAEPPKRTIEKAETKENDAKNDQEVPIAETTFIDNKETHNTKELTIECRKTPNGVEAKTESKTIDKKSTLDNSKPVDDVDSKAVKKTIEKPSTSKDSTVDNKSTEQGKANKTIDKQAKGKRDQSVGRGLGLRKTRLIEGLSTPVESDVGMKMMRQMGWDGGPLGLRGDGLAEPVMPAIHLKLGAGLGHVAPEKKPKPPKPQPPKVQPQPQKPAQPSPPKPLPPKTAHCHKPSNIRLDILHHILCLLTDKPLERIVVYSTKLSKKEVNFIDNTVKVLVKRGPLVFNDGELQAAYGKIIVLLVATPELQVACLFGADKKSVIFSKESNPFTSQSAIEITSLPIEVMPVIVSKYINKDLITTEDIGILGKQLAPKHTGKAARLLGHKVILLSAILDFLNSEDTEKTIKFNYQLVSNKVTYLGHVEWGIKHRQIWPCSHRYEKYLTLETLAAVEEYMYVKMTIGKNNRHITFQKMYSQLRKVNSKEPTKNNNVVSKETAKPNENDKKETVAKINDKGVAKNDAKTVNNNDVIVISDDDEPVNSAPGTSFENNTIGIKNAMIDADKEKNNVKVVNAENNDKVIKNKNNEKIIKNENNELAKQSNGAISKRPRSDSDESSLIDKKTKIYENTKYLGIAPDSYPMEEVGVDEIITLQNKIFEKLEGVKEKPLLECLGIKNGAIIYCCHNEFGKFLIENVATEMNLKTINITNLYKNRKPYKMKARINSYVEIDFKTLFTKIEEYNAGLKTEKWQVTDIKTGTDHVILSMDVDGESFDYISENNFSIFAGIDKVRFNATWD